MDYQDSKCDPAEIIDQNTGLKKLAYICAKPFTNRWDFYRTHRTHFWTDLVLAATVVILLTIIGSLWYYNNFKPKNQVEFNVDYNSDQLINGQQATFTVNYKNTSKKRLVKNSQVLIKTPQGLHNSKVLDSRYNPTTLSVNIGDLAPQEAGEIKIEGVVASNLGEKEKFLFVFNYNNDLDQPQQEFTSKEFKVEKSAIEISADWPARVFSASEWPLRVTLQNNSGQDFSDLTLEFNLPEKIKPVDNQPLTLEELKAGLGTVKSFNLVNDVLPSNEFNVGISLVHKLEDTSYILSRQEAKVNVERGLVNLEFIKTEDNKNISPGDQTTLSLSVTNNFKSAINLNSLQLSLTGDYLDNIFMTKNYDQNWKDNILNLPLEKTTLQPGEVLALEAKTAALAVIFVSDKNSGTQDIKARIRLNYQFSEAADSLINSNSSTLSIPINSSLNLKSQGLFYSKSGDQIGVGSVPPKIGEYTAYWAILDLTNGVNQVNNITIKAILPAGVEYDDTFNITRGAPVKFNGQQIEWFIPTLDPYDGLLSASVQSRIQLAVNPTESDLGKILPLLTNITVSGIDARTGVTISSSAADITTAIFKEQGMNAVSQ